MKKLKILKENWISKNYNSYLYPIDSFEFNNMLVIGYQTKAIFCHKTGLIISNKISDLIVHKILKSGLSSNAYLFPLLHNDYHDFFEIFTLRKEFLLYDNVQKAVMKQIFYNFPNWRDLPSHIKPQLKGKYWDYYYYLSTNFEYDSFNKKNNSINSYENSKCDLAKLQNEITQIKFVISQRSEANDMWPEQEKLKNLLETVDFYNLTNN